MAKAAIGAKVHQPLDIHRDFAAKVTLHGVVALDQFADLDHLGVGKLAHPALGGNLDLVYDLLRVMGADAVDVLQRDDHALVGRDIYASDARHFAFTP